MGKLILYGTIVSPPVRTVLLTLKALNLDYEFQDVNLMAGEHKSAQYLQKNPQHTVPSLDDNGRIVNDSHAIATYLISKYGKGDALYPKDFYLRALIDQKLHFDSGILYPRMRAIFEYVVKQGNSSIPEDKIAAVHEAYEFLEKYLDNSNRYLTSDSLTVADLCCAASVSSLAGIIQLDSETYPNLSAWLNLIKQLPYYDEANGKGAAILHGIINSKLH